MADVRLTATNPEDSSVVPVACNAKGELKLEEPIIVEGPPGPKGDKGDPGDPGKDGDPFTGNFEGDVSFTGSATFSEDVSIQGATVGLGGGGFVINTAIGQSALLENTNGSNNTAVGQGALRGNTGGSNNTAVGQGALRGNTEGLNNTAVGQDVLRANTTGINNTSVGRLSLTANTTGSNNTAFGRDTLRDNTEGENNVAVGNNAVRWGTEGMNNTGIGVSALRSVTTGGNNTAVGYLAGRLLEGSSNTFIGGYQGAPQLSDTLSLSTGETERMRIGSDDAVDFNQKCGFTPDGGLWITDTRGNKLRTNFASNGFMEWSAYEVVLRNEPQPSAEEME